MKNITLFIILLFHYEIALSHNLSANDRKNMNHEHKKILVQNVTANDSLDIWKNLMKNEYDPEIKSDYKIVVEDIEYNNKKMGRSGYPFLYALLFEICV